MGIHEDKFYFSMTYGNTLDKVGNKESERNLTDFFTNNYIGTPQPNKLCSLEGLAQTRGCKEGFAGGLLKGVVVAALTRSQ